tara:strand:+ start:8324 stop:8593 length:270 start_codon:yes stop_codon:yes gene_type:complete
MQYPYQLDCGILPGLDSELLPVLDSELLPESKQIKKRLINSICVYYKKYISIDHIGKYIITNNIINIYNDNPGIDNYTYNSKKRKHLHM